MKTAEKQRCCVADGITAQRDILQFKRTYLRDCPFHSELRDEADLADRRREERKTNREVVRT